MLDADIRDFFRELDQGWLERFLEHRIADKRVLRLIQKWLGAGVIEDGEWSATEAGTAQGASISPLLANVYLHYVFDLWADQWRRRNARGDVVLMRFADDLLAGFEHREDAERFLADLREQVRGVRFGAASGQDAADRVRTVRRRATRRVASGSLRRSSSWGSRISARRTGTGGSSSSASRARRRCAPSSNRSRPRCADGCTPDPRTGTLARQRPARALQLLRGARQQPGATRIPRTGYPALASGAHTPQPERPNHLAANLRLAARWLPKPRILHPWPNARFDARTQGRSPVR